VKYNGIDVIIPSPFSLSVKNAGFTNPTILKTETSKESHSWENPFGEKKMVPDNYNQIKLFLNSKSGNMNFICRVYNEGVAFAYEIISTGLDNAEITAEDFSFRFKEDYPVWATYTAQGVYKKTPLSKITTGCERPLLVECGEKLTIALAEAALVDYSRMKFCPDGSAANSIKTVLHGPVVKSMPFQSPWRVVMIAENPGKLLEQNYLLQNLSAPSALSNPTWIRPGKVIREVTLTTNGGKACVDFAAKNGLQYVEFDAGWYGPENDPASDATTVTLDPKRSKGPLDLKAVIDYAESKNIRVILYVNRRALEQQLDTLLPLFQSWGVAGIKYGFVKVGDQEWTRWLHDAVVKTSKYRMIVDIHDEYRPTGFSRTYPNLLTQEGIRGDEESISNSHTLITMFTRMLAGAADNTVCYYAERVKGKMGSHASQLAKTVCLFSPLQFLFWYDSPPQAPIKKDGLWGDTKTIGFEPELEFFSNVPTVWDETRVITGQIGEFAVIARRNGSQWFIGGINGERPVSTTIRFDFLEHGKKYRAKIYTDDPAINTRTQVRIEEINLDSKTELPLHVNANNGFAMQLMPE
jgi:alpha-glucosidase